MAPNVQAMRKSKLIKMDVVKGAEERKRILATWEEKFGNK